MKRIVLLLVLMMLAVPASGQSAEEAEPRATAVVEELRERIRQAIHLPRTAQESREEGVSEERVREVLETFRERRIPAGDAEEILQAENAAIRGGADKDEFGASVRAMKAGGLRGRELAAAIHAEQVARGMKKPPREARGRSQGDPQDKARGNDKARGGGDR